MTLKKRMIAGIIAILFMTCPSITVNATVSNKDTYISEEVQAACIKYGEEYNICPELLMAMCEKESSGKADAKNGSCKGVLQVNEKFHKERMKRLGVTDLYDIESNINVAADYLLELFEENGDIYLVLMKYNMGDATAERLYEQGIYSKYAISITERSEELERIHGQ